MSHSVALFNVHKVFHSATAQHQCIVNNTEFWLQVSFSSNHPQANIYHINYYVINVKSMGSRNVRRH